MLDGIRVESLTILHDRSRFSCGVEALDRYFRQQAGQDGKKRVAASFVAVLPKGEIAGFYTLSASSFALPALPDDIARKLPRYPQVPATLLGRLAVDQRFRGQGLGRFLLADALYRSCKSEIASFAVVVDAKDAEGIGFYEREGFMPFRDRPDKLFLPMATIAGLFR
jgi:GNAT superfamily N-acetyltransferase